MNRNIVLAGGCFWGVERYFQNVFGVQSTCVVYAQSRVAAPSYEAVCSGETGAVEAVEITYDTTQLSLEILLKHFFHIINPILLNQQGNDYGTQYRTGIYYESDEDLPVIQKVYKHIQKKYSEPLAVEVEVLKNIFLAEEYHQKYLMKHPSGYCHISLTSMYNDEDA